MIHHNTHEGFTILELLLALMLSSILIGALFAMLAQMFQSQKQIKEDHPTLTWQTSLTEQLQRDYRRCDSVIVKRGSVTLEGIYKTQEPEPFYQAAKVGYRVVSTDSGNILVREQVGLGKPMRIRELVCSGVSGFKTTNALSTDVAPGCLQLEVLFDSIDQSSLQVMLYRHGGLER